MNYFNSVLYNITQHEMSRLQCVMNRAARITLNITSPLYHPYHSSMNNLIQLHWLPIPYRIIFKIATITFKLLSTSSPSYLHNLILVKSTSKLPRSSNDNKQHHLQSISSRCAICMELQPFKHLKQSSTFLFQATTKDTSVHHCFSTFESFLTF